MSDLVAVIAIGPLVAALALGVCSPAWRRPLACLAVAFLIAAELRLGAAVAGGAVYVHHVGAWVPPFGIVLVADRLAVIMLLLASVTGFAVLLYDAAAPDPRLDDTPFFVLFLGFLFGLNGAFLTGDLFNLFVAFEVLLIASYGLLALAADGRQLLAGVQFTVLNLVASALFLVGVGIVYGLTGTLNFADLAVKVPAVAAADAALLQVGVLVLLIVFAAKAALLPLAFWLPDAYPAPPVPISAMFGGIATKVGVYALLRVFTTAFAEVRHPAADILLALAVVSMLIGVLGAVAQTEIRRLLSFHIVSQIGYLAFGVALFTVTGVAAALVYLVHYTIVKCALFLLGGLAESAGGSRDLRHLSGLAHRSPVLAGLFFVAGLSLAGVPPTSGFVSKLVLASAGLEARHYFAVTVAFGAGILTLFSMMKIWTMAFWGVPDAASAAVPRPLQLGAAALLVSFSVTLALAAEPLYAWALATAHQVMDVSAYVAAVLPPVTS